MTMMMLSFGVNLHISMICVRVDASTLNLILIPRSGIVELIYLLFRFLTFNAKVQFVIKSVFLKYVNSLVIPAPEKLPNITICI